MEEAIGHKVTDRTHGGPNRPVLRATSIDELPQLFNVHSLHVLVGRVRMPVSQ